MQTNLDQSAIDALFTAQTAGMPAPPTEAATTDLYDFGRTGQISNEQMRAISQVNDHFARNVMYTLGAWLRTQTQAVLVAGEQMSYGEFLSRIPEPSYVCLLRLEPLGGLGLMEMDLSLAMTMIDLLLGGTGRIDAARVLTDIENAILVSVVDVIVRELNSAWQSVGLQFDVAKPDEDGGVARLMPSAERTLCVSFEMEVMGVRGVLNFCLPAVVLNTIHRKLLAVSERPRARFEATGNRVAALMSEATLPVSLRLPVMRISSRAVNALTVGMVVELPQAKSVTAELLIGGVKVCGALPVSRDGRIAARLPTDTVVSATSMMDEVTA